MSPEIARDIFRIATTADFEKVALELFDYHIKCNPVYREFVKALGKKREVVRSVNDIPFLPIGFFRSAMIMPEGISHEYIFESSRTTGSVASRHHVHDLTLYKESFTRTFSLFYGEPSEYLIAALLPSYTERENSSLVYMAEKLIGMSRHRGSGFYKDNVAEMIGIIETARNEGTKVLLLGVSFALLDLASHYSPDLSGVIVMETGGMKGRRKEMTRSELHSILTSELNVGLIHSEFGMTELLSQGYSSGEGVFNCPPWMKIFMRDPYDPLCVTRETGKTGGINIIDLANIWSCPFIATDDLGRLLPGGGFEVLGRFDNSDIRGCNLMA